MKSDLNRSDLYYLKQLYESHLANIQLTVYDLTGTKSTWRQRLCNLFKYNLVYISGKKVIKLTNNGLKLCHLLFDNIGGVDNNGM